MIRRFSVLLLIASTACGASTIVTRGGTAPSRTGNPYYRLPGTTGARDVLAPQEAGDKLSAGVSLVPLAIPQFLFGPADPAKIAFQASSQHLVSLVSQNKRLHLTVLPSPADTVAIDLVEDSTPTRKWGELMTPAQRTIFRAFAADASLGKWLVIVDDINVVGGPDPIPVTAYLWARSDVESYASCGIPNTGIDGCTATFYERPVTEYVSGRVRTRGQ